MGSSSRRPPSEATRFPASRTSSRLHCRDNCFSIAYWTDPYCSLNDLHSIFLLSNHRSLLFLLLRKVLSFLSILYVMNYDERQPTNFKKVSWFSICLTKQKCILRLTKNPICLYLKVQSRSFQYWREVHENRSLCTKFNLNTSTIGSLYR